METVLTQVMLYLVAALVAVPLSQKLGFGSVLGYLAAGVAIGPGLGLVGAEAARLQHYAEFGVVLMLFLIGLELRPAELWALRRRLIGLGGLQVALTSAAIAGLAIALGQEWRPALAMGMILSLSSTAIVMQTLSEKRLTRTPGGEASFSVLLFQDMVAIPLLIALPFLALIVPVAEAGITGAGATPWGTALRIAGAAGVLLVAGTVLVRPLFAYIAAAGLRELYTATALALVVGTALLMTRVGLSPALGTFLAGVMLGNTEYRHELQSDIAPFKGLLLGLFFITVGAGLDVEALTSRPGAVLGLTLGVMAAKLAVLYAVSRLGGLAERSRLLFTLALAQGGEFGLFLASFAAGARVFPDEQARLVVLVISLSMFLTPALFALYERAARRVRGAEPVFDTVDATGPVIIAGVGRFGQVVNRLLTSLGHETVVMDHREEVISSMRRLGIRSYFGDMARPDFLETAGLAQARAIVIATDDPATTTAIATYVHRHYPDVAIIARAHDRHHVYALYAAGARNSVRETFDSALRAGRYALAELGYEEAEIESIAADFFRHDRALLAELAPLWRDDVPFARNMPYIAKAREQQAEIARRMQAGRTAGLVAAADKEDPDPA